jgi:hypothetical protein
MDGQGAVLEIENPGNVPTEVRSHVGAALAAGSAGEARCKIDRKKERRSRLDPPQLFSPYPRFLLAPETRLAHEAVRRIIRISFAGVRTAIICVRSAAERSRGYRACRSDCAAYDAGRNITRPKARAIAIAPVAVGVTIHLLLLQPMLR